MLMIFYRCKTLELPLSSDVSNFPEIRKVKLFGPTQIMKFKMFQEECSHYCACLNSDSREDVYHAPWE